LPGAIFLCLKYSHSIEDALVANAGIGGDNAVRGLVIGNILGAIHHGQEAIPSRWLANLNSLQRTQELFLKIANGPNAINNHVAKEL
jgi:ADP-ribosylglycohydrolase